MNNSPSETKNTNIEATQQAWEDAPEDINLAIKYLRNAQKELGLPDAEQVLDKLISSPIDPQKLLGVITNDVNFSELWPHLQRRLWEAEEPRDTQEGIELIQNFLKLERPDPARELLATLFASAEDIDGLIASMRKDSLFAPILGEAETRFMQQKLRLKLATHLPLKEETPVTPRLTQPVPEVMIEENTEPEDLGGGYSKDKKYVYFNGEKIPNADPKTFEFLKGEYARDSKSVYFNGNKILGANSGHFEILEGMYSTDGIYLFWENKKVTGVPFDIENNYLELLEHGYALVNMYPHHNLHLLHNGKEISRIKHRNCLRENDRNLVMVSNHNSASFPLCFFENNIPTNRKTEPLPISEAPCYIYYESTGDDWHDDEIFWKGGNHMKVDMKSVGYQERMQIFNGI